MCCSLIFLSCEKEEIGDLTGYFYTNIVDIEECVSRKGLEHERILVFMSTSSTKAAIFEIIHSKGKCERKTLKKYGPPKRLQ